MNGYQAGKGISTVAKIIHLFFILCELYSVCPFSTSKTWHRTALEGATRPLMESDLLNGFGFLLALGLSPN